ncbi:hypothetical protein CEXT_340291 [Caerostris extrusa]|uniref:Uncharacterized protein n=1 Tax=Caerostris extrusa TaxID=172846 RepID=A0AAV4S2I8_CAEEX|nr:hypothetical protein CEXT_340291 [Caerostris extrusa]
MDTSDLKRSREICCHLLIDSRRFSGSHWRDGADGYIRPKTESRICCHLLIDSRRFSGCHWRGGADGYIRPKTESRNILPSIETK